MSNKEEDSIIDFDFGSCNAITIHSYVFKPYKKTPKTWEIRGSNDRNEWTVIDRQSDYQNSFDTAFPINSTNKSKRFRYIRYAQLDAFGLPYQKYYVSISYFEFFGNIYQ